MKRVLYYVALMLVVIILLPFLIVRGCSREEEPPEEIAEKPEEVMIKVYISSEDRVAEMPLEEYLKGVVAAEMPAEFELEALKAQAVAARTYAYGRMKKIYVPKEDTHKGADICTDFAHCQAWVSEEEARKKWGIFKASRYWSKIEKAVDETAGILLIYDGKIINPVFHANSGGKTENAEDVWAGSNAPYLRSVVSNGEEASAQYKYTVSINIEDFVSTLKKEYPDIKLNEKDVLSDIEILDYTEGNRVKTMRIGNIELKGTEFRKLFSLRSANFTIEKGDKNTLRITTIGNGHGVGMSQWGANYLAKNGGVFEEILKYYYQGIDFTTISDFEGR